MVNQAVINLAIVLAPVWIMGLALVVDRFLFWLYN
jgi:hypothetical protein